MHSAPLLPELDGADVYVTLVTAHPEIHRMTARQDNRNAIETCGHCRSSEALLTKQAAALVRGVDLAAGLRNRLHLLLDLHAAASLPVTHQALTMFVTSICLVKVSHHSLLQQQMQTKNSFFHHRFLTLPAALVIGSMQTIGRPTFMTTTVYCQPEMQVAACY